MGNNLPFVDIGFDSNGEDLLAIDIALGYSHTCVLISDGRVKCWGNNYYGHLGQGSISQVGDLPGQMGNRLPFVNLGIGAFGNNFTAQYILSGIHHTCAVLNNYKLK